MEDTNIWYDAYTAYLRHQLESHAPPEGLDAGRNPWQPDLVLDTVARLWPPYAAPRWPHLIRGLEWACSEHEHRDEFAIALALAQRMSEEYAEEQAALARDLAGELTELFEQFVRGEIDFAEVSFATYDVLQDLHVVATGAYELVEADEDMEDEDDEDEATEEQEDLSGEPAR